MFRNFSSGIAAAAAAVLESDRITHGLSVRLTSLFPIPFVGWAEKKMGEYFVNISFVVVKHPSKGQRFITKDTTGEKEGKKERKKERKKVRKKERKLSSSVPLFLSLLQNAFMLQRKLKNSKFCN